MEMIGIVGNEGYIRYARGKQNIVVTLEINMIYKLRNRW
jgi:hypothetical protein